MAKNAETGLKLTAANLKNALWKTLQKVKDGKMDAGAADSIATQAREIVRTCNLQLQVAKQTKRSVPQDIVNFSEEPEG